VIQTGLEPVTRSLEGCCSIQLSYWTKFISFFQLLYPPDIYRESNWTKLVVPVFLYPKVLRAVPDQLLRLQK
jgi:hypothetical protein